MMMLQPFEFGVVQQGEAVVEHLAAGLQTAQNRHNIRPQGQHLLDLQMVVDDMVRQSLMEIVQETDLGCDLTVRQMRPADHL